jgi:hypothetical protein
MRGHALESWESWGNPPVVQCADRKGRDVSLVEARKMLTRRFRWRVILTVIGEDENGRFTDTTTITTPFVLLDDLAPIVNEQKAVSGRVIDRGWKVIAL